MTDISPEELRRLYLPDKTCLERCVEQVFVALKPGGILIAMAPNIRRTGGSY
jgi:predicted methyltransferase